MDAQGLMGHTENDMTLGRMEISLNMGAVNRAAEKAGYDKGPALLQSTILHELAHACRGSELDAKYIETLFYPHALFNKINYNDSKPINTYGVICNESKEKYKGSDPNIRQGNFIQWDSKNGGINCMDKDGNPSFILSDNDGSMNEQTNGLWGCP